MRRGWGRKVGVPERAFRSLKRAPPTEQIWAPRPLIGSLWAKILQLACHRSVKLGKV